MLPLPPLLLRRRKRRRRKTRPMMSLDPTMIWDLVFSTKTLQRSSLVSNSRSKKINDARGLKLATMHCYQITRSYTPGLEVSERLADFKFLTNLKLFPSFPPVVKIPVCHQLNVCVSCTLSS